ncbi:8-oxoguanine deaminase [Sediminispirochaeta bajacaliforniensis]|uniref:8-oxoguanine deaminase n=1 Tax=Sediminispirochaeta bajacaliforniensis TaxID=148 RepID=UPI0003787494|nr:8-oxoguanine deaminase [Sediminispirochaeta bajacaliforniensis]
MAKLLLKDIYYLHPGGQAEGLRGYDMLVDGNKIASIAPKIDPAGADRVIDCSTHVVVPGLVNTHHHFYQTLTRNIPAVQNAKLFDWLVYLYEVWKHIDEEAVYYSSLLAMAELLKTGCTLTTDHHYLYPNNFAGDLMGLQFEAAETLGMRFSPTRGSMSLSKKDGGLPPDSVVQTEEVILADSERVISQYHDRSDFSMRKVVLAPCSPFSVTEQLMKDSAALARQHGVRLHTHLAETLDENDFCVQVYGRRPVLVMADCDFLGDDVFFAHGIHFNDEELDILAQTGSHIAHCPASNMRLGSGICRVSEMLPRGINVALGVDGSASNDTSDLLGEARQAMLLQRVKYGSGALTAKQTFKIASENGARLLGYEKVGRLEEGMAADMAIWNVDRLEYAGALSDPLAALLFSGYDHGTAYTIVNGEVVVDEGCLVGFDERELTGKANAIAARLLEER